MKTCHLVTGKCTIIILSDLWKIQYFYFVSPMSSFCLFWEVATYSRTVDKFNSSRRTTPIQCCLWRLQESPRGGKAWRLITYRACLWRNERLERLLIPTWITPTHYGWARLQPLGSSIMIFFTICTLISTLNPNPHMTHNNNKGWVRCMQQSRRWGGGATSRHQVGWRSKVVYKVVEFVSVHKIATCA